MKRAELKLLGRLKLTEDSEELLGRPVGILISCHKRHEYLAAERLLASGKARVLWRTRNHMEIMSPLKKTGST